MWRSILTTALTLPLCSAILAAPPDSKDDIYFPTAVTQTEADEYTRYELLAPGSASFRIDYEVSATTAGAKFFYNPIRKGSSASEESVLDAARRTPLHFEVVTGTVARKDPLMPDADPATDYIKVTLARPVPEHGEGRLLILKTYKPPKSYYLDGKTIVFNRPLGVKRNKVLLPAGYEVVGLTVPSQILTEKDGRIAVSFLHSGAGEAPLENPRDKRYTGRRAGETCGTDNPTQLGIAFRGANRRGATVGASSSDRAIVYFLQQPGTHAFKLYHEYTETRAGVNGYANVVRGGSVASDPSAIIVDTGQRLKAQEMSGADMAASGINTGESVEPTAHVVVIPFDAVRANQTLRLRITETYSAPSSYGLDGDDLVFDRSLGRSRNAVVLPAGWYCTFSSIPATVSQLPDGRVRLDYWDDRPEDVDVLLKARRRSATSEPTHSE